MAGVKPTHQCGRVERLFKTVQDRRVKERRLAGGSTLAAANRLLNGYLPIYTRRFSVQPAQPAARQRPRPASRELDRSLCLSTTRCLRRDWTVAHHGPLYQRRSHVRATHVIVEDRVEGTLWRSHNGQPLTDQPIIAHPLRVPPPPTIARQPRTVTPTRAHPWRKRLLPTRDAHAAAALT